MKPRLGPKAVGLIEQAVGKLFQKIREQTFGDKHPHGKKLYIAYKPELTLKGIFDAAATEEGVKPTEDIFKTLIKISGSYLDAAEAKAKAKMVHAVQTSLQEAASAGVKTNFKTVLTGKLYEVMGEAHRDVHRIMATESTIVRNTSILDGIGKVNAAAGIDDPTVFFVTVRDQYRCDECTRLHVQPDGVTPRVWKMSELGSGYHKRGDPNPKIGGLHPHCRCVLTTLMPGYGFDGAGKVQYKTPGYDEFNVQRGVLKTEEEIGEPLEKGFTQAKLKHILRSFGWTEKPGAKHDVFERPGAHRPITFQRGYVGDYDWQWVDTHLKEAGLLRNRGTNEVAPDPSHAMFPHYQKTGHAEIQKPTIRTWEAPGATDHIPVDQIEAGDVPDGKAHADAVRKLKTGQAGVPHVEVIDLGGGSYGSLNNHHVLQAARDAGMTHVPVKLAKKEPGAPQR